MTAALAAPSRKRSRMGAWHRPEVRRAIKRRLVADLIAEFQDDPFGAAARGESIRRGLPWFRGE